MTVTFPVPVSASIVPLVAKFTVPPLVTVTATALVSAPELAQLNWPPVTSKFALATVPLTVNTPPLTSVSPVYVFVPLNVPGPVPPLVSEPLPLRVPP